MHVLVAGGSRGIGAACVRAFAAAGHDITLIYNNTFVEGTDKIYPVKCDVSDPDDVRNAVISARDRFGDIEALVYCSGISLTGLVTDFDQESYKKIMDTNFGGLFYMTHEVLPDMIRNHNGTITAVSSMWGQTGASCEALYSASKGAVDAYIKSLAKEVGPSGIRVNAVSPGVVDTDMMNEYSQDDKDKLADETALGRIGTPDEIAKAICYLTSDDASFITGQIIGVNGGFLI